VRSFRRLDVDARIIEKAGQSARVAKLVLPGVGSFGPASDFLRNSGFASVIMERVRKGDSVLGVCLGFHLFCETSEESGAQVGLSLFKAKVKKLLTSKGRKVPHVGWTRVSSFLGAGIASISVGSRFYFSHSFEVKAAEPRKIAGCTARYGQDDLLAAWHSENILGVQFHPEKSGENGLRLLQKFAQSE